MKPGEAFDETARIERARLHEPAHAGALLELMDAYARDPVSGGRPLPESTRSGLAAKLAERPGSHVLLAFCGDTPAGLLIAFEGFSTFACKPLLNVHDVAVAPRFRGRGIAGRLFETLQVIGAEIGACKLTLEVLEGNASAHRAYRRLGFRPCQSEGGHGLAQFWQLWLEPQPQIQMQTP